MADVTTPAQPDLESLLCDIAQIFDGWHADGTAWSEWDESVRKRLGEYQIVAYRRKYPAPGLMSVAVTGGDAEPATVDTTEDDLRRVAELDREATPGPWTYSQEPSDDWGYVRGPIRHKPDWPGWIVAIMRGGRHETEDELNVHRREGTDPYEHDARLIAEYRTLCPRLAASLRAARSRIAEVEASYHDKRIEYDKLWDEANQFRTERDTARAELAAAKKDCPWDLPFDSVCPKHGGKLTECPVKHSLISGYQQGTGPVTLEKIEMPNELWNWDDRKLGD